MFVSDVEVRAGGALCRLVSAPAQTSQHRWGVSDPAFAEQMRPRARPAGSLPPTCQVDDGLGRACKVPSNPVANGQHFQVTLHQESDSDLHAKFGVACASAVARIPMDARAICRCRRRLAVDRE